MASFSTNSSISSNNNHTIRILSNHTNSHNHKLIRYRTCIICNILPHSTLHMIRLHNHTRTRLTRNTTNR